MKIKESYIGPTDKTWTTTEYEFEFIDKKQIRFFTHLLKSFIKDETLEIELIGVNSTLHFQSANHERMWQYEFEFDNKSYNIIKNWICYNDLLKLESYNINDLNTSYKIQYLELKKIQN